MMSMDSSTTNSPKTAAAGFAQFLSSLEEVEGENDFSSIDWQSMNDDNDRRNTSLIERLQRQGSQVKLNTSIAMTPTIRAPSAAPTPAAPTLVFVFANRLENGRPELFIERFVC